MYIFPTKIIFCIPLYFHWYISIPEIASSGCNFSDLLCYWCEQWSGVEEIARAQLKGRLPAQDLGVIPPRIFQKKEKKKDFQVLKNRPWSAKSLAWSKVWGESRLIESNFVNGQNSLRFAVNIAWVPCLCEPKKVHSLLKPMKQIVRYPIRGANLYFRHCLKLQKRLTTNSNIPISVTPRRLRCPTSTLQEKMMNTKKKRKKSHLSNQA